MPKIDDHNSDTNTIALWKEINKWLARRLSSDQLYEFQFTFIHRFLEYWLPLPRLTPNKEDIIAVFRDKRPITASVCEVMHVFTLASLRLLELAPIEVYEAYTTTVNREFTRLIERQTKKQCKFVSLMPSSAVREVDGE